MPNTQFFEVIDELPEETDREDVYATLRTLRLLQAAFDPLTMEVLAGVAYARLNVPRWKKFTVTYAQLATAGLTNDIQLFILPGAGIIERTMIKHSVAFAGGAISAYTISIGIAANLVKYAAAFNIFQAVADGTFQLTSTAGCETFAAAGTSIRVKATSTTANLDAATAGSVDIWVKYGAAL